MTMVLWENNQQTRQAIGFHRTDTEICPFEVTLESSQAINVLGEGDRKLDSEATLGWRRDLRALDGVFARPSPPHPMCDWIDAQVTRLHRLQEVVNNMVYSARPMLRGREKVTSMDFVFAVALHSSDVPLAVSET